MIELRDISKSFGGQELFQQGSFAIGANEKIGLVGRNGHGKTTLFGLINKTLETDAGSIVIPKNYKIGSLHQNILFSKDTVLAEACVEMTASEQGDSWKAEKVLHGLGFSVADMQRSPLEFSGGFQVRINLAKILVSQANLLLLDEPNNYLDVVAIRWLIRFLRQWRGELMLITHDRCFMDAVVTHIVGIHRKGMRKMSGTTQRFYEQISQEEDIYEKTRKRDERKRKQTEEFISKFRAKARQAGLAQSRLKSIAKLEQKNKLEEIKIFDISFNAAPFNAATMMNVNNISFSYNEKSPILFDKTSFRVGRRERLCVIGKNGKGKSTLLRVLAGELSSLSGAIKSHPRLAVGYYAQSNTAQLSREHSVLAEVLSADPAGLPQRARTICGSLLFSQDLALKPISVLSGGEKSRVLLGKILMQPCHLLLLDEPTNHLDMESSDALCRAIEEFDGSVIMVTHNELFLERIAQKLLVFEEAGVRYFDGTYSEFLNKVGWQDEEGNLKADTQYIASETPKTDRRTHRRMVAELRHEQARVLKPLEVSIDKMEIIISGLETELRIVNEDLVEASYQADKGAIAELSRKIKELPEQIDEYYTKLDDVFKEYESKREEFIRRLVELTGDASERTMK
ncbi:MAG: ABC-F family ATP-binding cassette domain-containing protein [Candidatus Omnitrophica bacterium]|nr:ABC-F family ATP-binding cassette domain-containing protein [Candidatus Omnitrophota bacterium]